MSRYIDADALIAEFPHDEDWNYPVNTNSYVVEAINSAPSIDIVRCKECGNKDKDCDYCNEHDMKIRPDDYCSFGERESE